ncbi:MAG: UDP-2,3-diacylglucosamine diphosphatase [Pseudobdellovibrionaceae bacterium]
MQQQDGKLQKREECAALFISDLHMGSTHFDAPRLLTLLRSHNPRTLYMVGDIIDGWKLRKNWYWPEAYAALMREVLQMAENGTHIVYITGNHDERLRFLPQPMTRKLKNTFGITVKNELVHTGVNGKRWLVIHGDQFDWSILHGRLSRWGDHFYEWLSSTFLVFFTPRVRLEGKWKKFSLSKALRASGTHTLYLIKNFESAVFRRIQNEHVDGLICGHTHIPIIKTLEGKTYMNCGSGVGPAPTALIERLNGTFELIPYPSHDQRPPSELSPVSQDIKTREKELRVWIQRIWPAKKQMKTHYVALFQNR